MATVKTNRKEPVSPKHKAEEKSVVAPARPRRLSLPAYRPFRFKRVKYPEHLPSVWRLTTQTVELFWSRKWVFIGIAAIYAVLTLFLLIGSGALTDVVGLKSQFNFGTGYGAQLLTSASVLTALFTSSGTNGGTGGPTQLLIGLIISLATIWAARQVLAGQKITVRDAFYLGMFPLVPFVAVLLVVLLEALPLVVGTWILATALTAGIAASSLEQLLWIAVFLVLAFISIYMWCASLFALYIVTLPDMRPIKALRSARQLVRYRRGQVARKLIYLPAALFVVTVVIMLPAILFVAPLAPWIFFTLTTFSLIFVHLYMYTVYKALLA